MYKRFAESYNVVNSFLQFHENNFFIVVYDMETTGLKSNGDRPIQISARKCLISEDGISETDSKMWYINPGRSIPDKVVELTGITDEMLEDKPKENEVIGEIAEFFEELPVCGYCNDKFDNEFMECMYERNGLKFEPDDSVDIYRVVKEVVRPGETENQKLATITDYFGFSDEITAFHNAESDSLATILCYNRLLELCRKYISENTCRLIPCGSVKSVKRYEVDTGKRSVRRIYVNTDKGKSFYYDLTKKTWGVGDKSDRIGRYDVDELIDETLRYTGCETLKDLSHYA